MKRRTPGCQQCSVRRSSAAASRVSPALIIWAARRHRRHCFRSQPRRPIGTVHLDGCILETGPESWLASKPWAEQLIRELGLGDELTGSNDAQRRTYVLRDGRFVTLPEGLQMVVPTKICAGRQTELFSWKTKFRMGA